jgi:phage terminase small subunit
MTDNLTAKQKRFCEEYVIDWNGTRAAIAAGYSEKTAKEIASENLTKPNIKDYIEQVREDLEKQAGISALRNLLELKKLAYSNTSQMYDGWLTMKEYEELPENVKASISEIQTSRKITDEGESLLMVKVKMHDKMKAIDMINKMLGYNAPDKMNHSGSVSIVEQLKNTKFVDAAKLKEKTKDD